MIGGSRADGTRPVFPTGLQRPHGTTYAPSAARGGGGSWHSGGVADALRLLAEGRQIDYEGVTTTLDWDADGDLREGYIGVWRFTPGKGIEEVETVFLRDGVQRAFAEHTGGRLCGNLAKRCNEISTASSTRLLRSQSPCCSPWTCINGLRRQSESAKESTSSSLTQTDHVVT